MIQMNFTNAGWGTNEIKEVNPDNGDLITGRRINILDQDSGILASVPFVGDSLPKLVTELAKSLTPDQKRELAPLFTSGIVLP